MIDLAVDLMQGTSSSIDDRKHDLNIILSELNNTFYKLAKNGRKDMVYDSETRKHIEDAFNIINDYTIDLYYLSIQNKIKHYVDFITCWACLDDLKCAYREIVEKTQ